MHAFDNIFTPEAWWEALDVLLKLGLGAVLGGAIGLEREKAGRPAGIRTHMLLVLGVVLICEVSKVFPGPDEARIAAQIVTGVGFLGAGTIMRTGLEVKGLTTAASLWAASAIGFAVSTGGAFLVVAVVATLLTLFTLAVVDNIERRLVPHAEIQEVRLKLDGRAALVQLLDTLNKGGFSVENVRIAAEGDGLSARIGVQGEIGAILEASLGCEGVLQAEAGTP